MPPGTDKVGASSEECVVWRREQSFARSLEQHDAAAFVAHLHPGAIFDAGAVGADRGRNAVANRWADLVRGEASALRWRPGLVHIGGEANVALSRGPYILQTLQDGDPVFRVGFFQTVWMRAAPQAPWLVLFDASASTPLRMEGRAAADRWVEGQAMADCAPP